jgi:transcriptional regulator with XRE-family HTH domain
MQNMQQSLTREDVQEIDRHVGRRLRYRRIMMDFSQTYLADKVGLSFQQFQKYEKGANRISASKLHDFAVLLDVPVSFFFDDMPGDMKAASLATAPAIDADENPFKDPQVRAFVQAYQALPGIGLRRAIYQAVKAVARQQSAD